MFSLLPLRYVFHYLHSNSITTNMTQNTVSKTVVLGKIQCPSVNTVDMIISYLDDAELLTVYCVITFLQQV